MNHMYLQQRKTPYPLGSLPEVVRNFVEQVAYQTQSAPSHAATAALSAMASAVQGHLDVQHPYGEISPTSLYTWIVARSGERKSAIARLVNWAIEDYESAGMDSRPDHPDLGVGVGQEATTPPHQFWFEDATVPSILEAMSEGAKSIYCSTDEGGVLLRFLDMANYCKWWDGATIRHNRKNKPPVLLTGRRVSLCVQIQDAVFERFLQKNRERLLESGLLARTLFIRPESLQGMRSYSWEAPPRDAMNSHPFNQRMKELLRQDTYRQGKASYTATLDPAAVQIWRNFCYNVESCLGHGGYFSDVPMFANRASHIAVRLAAVLQFFNNQTTVISATAMDTACQIAWWHLEEAKSSFGTPPESHQIMLTTQKLIDWLHRRPYEPGRPAQVLKSEVLRFGPLEPSRYTHLVG